MRVLTNRQTNDKAAALLERAPSLCASDGHRERRRGTTPACRC